VGPGIVKSVFRSAAPNLHETLTKFRNTILQAISLPFGMLKTQGKKRIAIASPPSKRLKEEEGAAARLTTL